MDRCKQFITNQNWECISSKTHFSLVSKCGTNLQTEKKNTSSTQNIRTCLELVMSIPHKSKERTAFIRRYSVKKVFLEISQNSQENNCEFCEISRNAFFKEHLWATGFVSLLRKAWKQGYIPFNPFYVTGYFLYPMKT